jgi:uncharacterized protein YndB with AHSA1/START domain
MTDGYEITRVVPATPKRLFEVWLDSREHGSMTGRAATVSWGVDDPLSVLDGLITGTNLEVEPNRHIAQRWRTKEPGLGVSESRVELELITGWRFKGGVGSPFAGTTLIVRHSGLPSAQTTFNADWWEENYFKPMDAYFGQGRIRWTRPLP